MGSSQSKRTQRRLHRHQQLDTLWSPERLQHDSLAAAIAANKRQRKLLLEQAKLANEYKSHYSLASSHHHHQQQQQNGSANVAAAAYRRAQGSSVDNIGRLLSSSSPSPEPIGAGAMVPDGVHRLAPAKLRPNNEQQQRASRQRQPLQPTLAFTGNNNHPVAMQASASRETLAMGLSGGGGSSQASNTMMIVSGKGFKAPSEDNLSAHWQQANNILSEEDPLDSYDYFRQLQQPPLQVAQQPTRRLRRRRQNPAALANYQARQRHQAAHYPLSDASYNNHFYNRLQAPSAHPLSKLRVGHSQSSVSLYSSSQSSLYNQQPQEIVSQQMHHQQFHQNNHSSSSSSGSKKAGMAMQQLSPRFQKGLAFGQEERIKLNLSGHLPAAHQDLDLQVKGVLNMLDNVCSDDLNRYIYLRNLKDFNEKLFYSTLMQNVEKLMPLVYTPVVGLACQKFSEIYLRPRGLFITINDLENIPRILLNHKERDVRVIVVTDGERILGLGDLGANGMGISIGKLSLYTALAGIPPQNVLPICLDVGTNNEQLLNDPLYIGLKHRRIDGDKYLSFIDHFMASVTERWGRSCLVQFEDFANSAAFQLLQRYRDKYCTFNDDIQGTASVCLSGLISAIKRILNMNRLLDSNGFLFYGAGEANLGTAQLLCMAMLEEDPKQTFDQVRRKIFLVDSKGLIVTHRKNLSSHKRRFAQDLPEEEASKLTTLLDIIEHSKPTAIVGASAQGKAFTKDICQLMAKLNERPIIFALSNPTSKAECTAQEAYNWTDGKCVFASGSPFEPVIHNNKTYITGQGNNAYIFPAVGLAAIAAHVLTIPEDTFLVAAKALSDQLTKADVEVGLVYPKLNRIREVTLKVASRVLEHFYNERLATYRPEPDDKYDFLKSIQYDSRYESVDQSPNPNQINMLGE